MTLYLLFILSADITFPASLLFLYMLYISLLLLSLCCGFDLCTPYYKLCILWENAVGMKASALGI